MAPKAYFQLDTVDGESVIDEEIKLDGGQQNGTRRLFKPGFRWLDGVTEVMFVVQPNENNNLGMKVLSTRPAGEEQPDRQRTRQVIDGQEFFQELPVYDNNLSRVGEFRRFGLVGLNNGFEVKDYSDNVRKITASLEFPDHARTSQESNIPVQLHAA